MSTVYRLELKRGALSLCIWTAAIAFMLGISILIYPEMSSQIEEINVLFADMGSFSAAFGMDSINFGEFTGYFATECGNTLGLGGALYAAYLGVSALAKEEKERTAEFLLSHPVERNSVVLGKLCAVFTQVTILNLATAAVVVLTALAIGADADPGELALLLFASLLMQLELAAVTFGISAFLKRGAAGVGLGLAFLLYFLNILANLTEKAEFLKYLTPFSYAEGAGILSEHALNGSYLAVGCGFAVLGIAAAFLRYRRKDIA